MDNVTKLTGKGLAFPIKLDEKGKAQLTVGFDLLKSSLQQILAWSVGTRYFLGEYGTVIPNSLEEPPDDVTQTYIEYQLTQRVPQWDQRFSIKAISFTRPGMGRLNIVITIAINKTPVEETWEFPLSNNEITY